VRAWRTSCPLAKVAGARPARGDSVRGWRDPCEPLELWTQKAVKLGPQRNPTGHVLGCGGPPVRWAAPRRTSRKGPHAEVGLFAEPKKHLGSQVSPAWEPSSRSDSAAGAIEQNSFVPSALSQEFRPSTQFEPVRGCRAGAASPACRPRSARDNSNHGRRLRRIDHTPGEKRIAATDRPVHRPAGEPQLAFDLSSIKLQGLNAPAGRILFVKGEDRQTRRIPEQLKQLAGLGLRRPLAGVFEHHRVYRGGQGAVGVLLKNPGAPAVFEAG